MAIGGRCLATLPTGRRRAKKAAVRGQRQGRARRSGGASRRAAGAALLLWSALPARAAPPTATLGPPARSAAEPLAPDRPALEEQLLRPVLSSSVSLGPPPPPAAPAAPPPPPPPPPHRRPLLEVALGAAASTRDGGTDLLLQAGLLLGALPALGLGLELGHADGSAPLIDVNEWTVQAVGLVDVELTPVLSLEMGARAGVRLHVFERSAADAMEARGTEADLVLAFPFRLHFRSESIGVALWTAAGGAPRGRSHTQGGQEIWRRGALFLEAGLCLTSPLLRAREEEP